MDTRDNRLRLQSLAHDDADAKGVPHSHVACITTRWGTSQGEGMDIRMLRVPDANGIVTHELPIIAFADSLLR